MLVHGYEMRSVGEPLVPSVREVGELKPGQVLVEVSACGVCHTDLGFLFDGVPTRHPPPLVLGHEISGRVVGAGEGADEWLDKRVVVPAVMPCGKCEACRAGQGSICPRQVFPGNDDHGGFASHVVVPAAPLCELPPEFDDAAARRACVIADAVSTAYAAVSEIGLKEGDFAVFVGAGGVGGFGIQVARAKGARVLAIDVDADRLELVRSHGATWTLDASGKSPREIKQGVKELTKSESLPRTNWRIFETSGTAAGQETAFQLLTFGARLAVVGFHPGDVRVRLSNLMAFSAQACGVWGCPPADFPDIVRLVQRGEIQLEPFVEEFPMSRINEVLKRLKNHELRRRPVLVPDGFSKPRERPDS